MNVSGMNRAMELIGSTSVAIHEIADTLERGAAHARTADSYVEDVRRPKLKREHRRVVDPTGLAQASIKAHADLLVGERLVKQLTEHAGIADALTGAGSTGLQAKLASAANHASSARERIEYHAAAATDLAASLPRGYSRELQSEHVEKPIFAKVDDPDFVRAVFGAVGRAYNGAGFAMPNGHADTMGAIMGEPRRTVSARYNHLIVDLRSGGASHAHLASRDASEAATELREFSSNLAEILTARETNSIHAHYSEVLAQATANADAQHRNLAQLLDAATGIDNALPAPSARPALEA